MNEIPAEIDRVVIHSPPRPAVPIAREVRSLTAEELAELIDSIREDEIAAAIAGCTECDPEYND
jgi:hypothetical protein